MYLLESIDYWRFCTELTVVQAALLIIGVDPTPHLAYVSRLKPEEQPTGYHAVFAALKNDIVVRWLTAHIEHIPTQNGDIEEIDWEKTTISVTDLKGWLSERGVTTGFFFPDKPVTADYLDRGDSFFSLKLAAAVEAWQAVKAERNNKTSGKSVKADLTKWLMLNAPKYGLISDDGGPNKLAIEEVAKVANWDQKGGAPKTPGPRG